MEKVFCISRENLERLMGKPLPYGTFPTPGIEKVLALPFEFIPKENAENDPNWKQIIPYQIFSHKNTFFVYKRGNKSGELRLSYKYSIGVGGHINLNDFIGFYSRVKSKDENGNMVDFYKMALIRERNEEIGIISPKKEFFMGWINDDTEPVGQVHLGAIHLCITNEPHNIKIKEKENLSFIGWWDIEKIFENSEKFEKWSVLSLNLLSNLKKDPL